jgi:hypothetical protein
MSPAALVNIVVAVWAVAAVAVAALIVLPLVSKRCSSNERIKR